MQVLKDHIASEVHTRLECRALPDYQHCLVSITELFQRWLHWRPEAPTPRWSNSRHSWRRRTCRSPRRYRWWPRSWRCRCPPIIASRSLPPEQQRQRTLDTLLAMVGALAEQQPVLLIVEDLHWVDPSTMELLALLIDQVPTVRIFTVLTCRPTAQPLGLPHASRTPSSSIA